MSFILPMINNKKNWMKLPFHVFNPWNRWSKVNVKADKTHCVLLLCICKRFSLFFIKLFHTHSLVKYWQIKVFSFLLLFSNMPENYHEIKCGVFCSRKKNEVLVITKYNNSMPGFMKVKSKSERCHNGNLFHKVCPDSNLSCLCRTTNITSHLYEIVFRDKSRNKKKKHWHDIENFIKPKAGEIVKKQLWTKDQSSRK